MAPIRFLALATLIALAGCTTTPPPPAVLAFDGKACTAEPVLTGASSLTPEKPQPSFAVAQTIDAAAPCLTRSGSSVPYRVFALPKSPETMTVIAGAVLEANRLIAPSVTTLDANGKVTRTFAADDYFFRGDVYSVLFKPRPGDAFVMVSVDPSKVGQEYKSVFVGTSTSSVYVGHGLTATTRSGIDQKELRVYSYEGSVRVTVLAPKATPAT